MTAAEPAIAASYRELFAQPVSRRLAAADVCARLPQGMVGITLLLVAAQHASMPVAGLVVAGYTLGQAATGPVRGRLADRRGLVPVAAVCSLSYALALMALLASSLAAAPAGLLVGTAIAAGLVNPPLSPGMRSLWSAHAGARLRQTAFALDAAVFDLAYITGPVLAGGAGDRPGPGGGGGRPAGADRHRGDHRGRPGPPAREPARRAPSPACRTAGPARRRSLLGPLRSGALRELLIAAALVNAALSATEVALTAYARAHHALWASGPLLAGVSIGSIVGSLVLGARVHRLPRLLAGYACGLAVLTAAGLYAPLLAVAAPLAGLCLGPTLATLFGAAAAAAPRGSGTETQSWLNSIMNGGAAGGAAMAGLASARPVLALGLAAATAVAAALAAALSAAGTPRRNAMHAPRPVRPD